MVKRILLIAIQWGTLVTAVVHSLIKSVAVPNPLVIRNLSVTRKLNINYEESVKSNFMLWLVDNFPVEFTRLQSEAPALTERVHRIELITRNNFDNFIGHIRNTRDSQLVIAICSDCEALKRLLNVY